MSAVAPLWVVAAVAALTLLAPSSALGSTSLVFSSAELTTLGLHPVPTTGRAASTQLSAGLTGQLVDVAHDAPVQASAARMRGSTLYSDAFAFRTRAVAERVLAVWRKTHHAAPVSIGAGGAASAKASHRRAVVQVLWRDRDRLGLIVLSASRDASSARGRAIAYAQQAESYLAARLPSTASAKVLDQVEPTGAVSEQTALQAFALAYGPVPGVRPPSGPIGQIPDGTIAADWVLGYRSRLPQRQLRVVDHLLGLPAPDAGAHVAGPPDYGDAGFTLNAQLTTQANGWAQMYDTKFGITLPQTIVAGYTTTVVTNPHVGGLSPADAAPLENSAGGYGSGVPRICRVRVTASGKAGTSAALAGDLAHEVFHCFEYSFLGGDAWFGKPAAWVMEGLAVWAQLSVDGTTPNPFAYSLDDYINTSAKPLFTRAYDAVGFWGHVQDTLVEGFGSLWDRIPAILQAGACHLGRFCKLMGGSSIAAYNAAGAGASSFLDWWGSSVFELPSPAWRTVSPIAPTAKATAAQLDPALTGTVEAAPYTTSQYLIRGSSATPLLHVSIDGSARLGVNENDTQLRNAWFCTSASCACPDGTTGQTPASQPLATPAMLGLSGDPSGGSAGTVAAVPLSEFCKPSPSCPVSTQASAGFPLAAQAADGGGQCDNGETGDGGTFGDPHLLDFAGNIFDFQQAGEFTLVKSTQDDLQVQVRQQPLGNCCVAFNTAVAMRVGSKTVEVDGVGARLATYVNRVRVHGSRVALGAGDALTDSKAHGVPTAEVSWPDGSTVVVQSQTSDGVLMVNVSLTGDRIGHVAGVLGNWGVPASVEYVGRTGKRYPAKDFRAPDSARAQKVRYHQFGASWRITQRSSLFRYPPGKSTHSYTVPGFPSKEESLTTLLARVRRAATKACEAAGITNAQVLAGCELDVGATGNKHFATTDARVQRFISPAVGWTELSGGPETPIPAFAPSLASNAGKALAAYRSSDESALVLASLTPSSGTTGTGTRTTVLSGWSNLSNPILLPAPGGGEQLLFSGIDSSAPGQPAGTYLLALPTNGTVAAPKQIDSDESLGEGALLASDGTTPLWTTDSDGFGLDVGVREGSSDPPVDHDLGAFAPAGSVPAGATLARDTTGRLWLAWYANTLKVSTSFIFLLQLDPETGGPLADATAIQVPQSNGSLGGAQIAMACNAICHVVYTPSGASSGLTRLVSWAPGQAEPVIVATAGAGRAVYFPAAAAAPDGRLWIAYADALTTGVYETIVKLGNENGAGGTPTTIPAPQPAATPAFGTAIVVPAGLLLGQSWIRKQSSAIWSTVVPQP